jgi:hypothetical protein
MAKKSEKLAVPKFKTEAEEAKWWYDNREKVEGALIRAIDAGTIRRGRKHEPPMNTDERR